MAVQIWPVVQKHPNYRNTANCSALVVYKDMHLVSCWDKWHSSGAMGTSGMPGQASASRALVQLQIS